MPTKSQDSRQTSRRKAALPGQFIENLYNKDIVDRVFEDASVGGAKLTQLDQVDAGAGTLPIGSIPNIPGSKLTSLGSIPAGAGVIPSANLPAAAPSPFVVGANDSIYGPVSDDGNTYGAEAIDIQTSRYVGDYVSSIKGTAVGSALGVSGNYSVAIGHSSYTTGQSSVVIGHSSGIYYKGVVMLGKSCWAGGQYAVVIGRNATAYQDAVGIGNSADAGYNGSIAIGPSASTTAINTIVIKSGSGQAIEMDAAGLVTVTNLRINQTPSAGVLAATHYLPISLNGSVYNFLVNT